VALLYDEKNYLLNRYLFSVGRHIALYVHRQMVTIIKSYHYLNTLLISVNLLSSGA